MSFFTFGHMSRGRFIVIHFPCFTFFFLMQYYFAVSAPPFDICKIALWNHFSKNKSGQFIHLTSISPISKHCRLAFIEIFDEFEICKFTKEKKIKIFSLISVFVEFSHLDKWSNATNHLSDREFKSAVNLLERHLFLR